MLRDSLEQPSCRRRLDRRQGLRIERDFAQQVNRAGVAQRRYGQHNRMAQREIVGRFAEVGAKQSPGLGDDVSAARAQPFQG